MNRNWQNISYLKYGNERQLKAYNCLSEINIMNILNDYSATLVGTIPIEIDVDTSDLDIICEVYNFKSFEERLIVNFAKHEEFKIAYEKNVLTCNFNVDGFAIEIYATDIPVYRQNAYRHMLIEDRLLNFYGLHFKAKIIALKKQGIKTEPAFAKLLKLTGNPYQELLKFESQTDAQLPEIDFRVETLLDKFVDTTKSILKDSLVGVYLHGSYAMGCYNSKLSDIDLIVVVNSDVAENIKYLYMDESIKLNNELGGKGFEMSIVNQKFCNKNIYPIPYELHFSKFHLNEYRENASKYISKMQGVDEDLAAHFKMIYHRGKKLYGKAIKEVFIDTRDKYYLKSILYDLSDYSDEFTTNNTVYVVLNLCRTLAYLKERLVLSKKKGASGR